MTSASDQGANAASSTAGERQTMTYWKGETSDGRTVRLGRGVAGNFDGEKIPDAYYLKINSEAGETYVAFTPETMATIVGLYEHIQRQEMVTNLCWKIAVEMNADGTHTLTASATDSPLIEGDQNDGKQ